ncbi:ABC transporter ATP-binding protein [Homoserinimonas sp. OAct 916]|uniref:ABC transporter ATP-binding protein n=1 Tax=Homoserinimonas sp. OAct 916 TaxID=2211450 RepID=UPI000DBE30CE|nr:oligopeptide/dipeptide ABC transporter ATP-binding protein [Homoserinimonas sp. OAct 916]
MSEQATIKTSAAAEPLLKVRELEKFFTLPGKGLLQRNGATVYAVNGISLDVHAGRTLGVVGESGCGKSTAGRTIMRLLEPTGGKIEFDGRDITRVKGESLRMLRRQMQMVFQDPKGSLNSRQTIGTILSAPFRIQKVTPPGGTRLAIQDLMDRVGLNPEHYNRYPHEFSGGQQQRIGVARAIALSPKLIVCDEPVSALDASIQAQVVNLLKDIQDETGVAYVFIAHDLAVVRHIADEVAVMYLGQIMERGPMDVVFNRPMHPYTHALLSAVPILDPAARSRERIVLSRDLPSPLAPPSGCVFRTRCPIAQDICAVEAPPVTEPEPGHLIACHFPSTTPPSTSALPMRVIHTSTQKTN